MKIKIITLFPELIAGYLQDALISKAIKNNLINITIINLRDFSDNNYKSVDGSPFGGGDGMLIRADILEKAFIENSINKNTSHIIYFSPQGQLLDNNKVQNFAAKYSPNNSEELVLICGRYAGVDQRFIDLYVHEEISIGNYVLSGGELAALVFVESVSRHIDGVLGNSDSAKEDSLKDNLLEAPQYTRPQEWNGLKVPEVLLSGNHKKIEEWKKQMSLKVTEQKRPDLLNNSSLHTKEDK
jgi:tRNA (guanine37-N1)-methyltransferase